MIALHNLRLHFVSKVALEVPSALLHLKKQTAMNLKAAKKGILPTTGVSLEVYPFSVVLTRLQTQPAP